VPVLGCNCLGISPLRDGGRGRAKWFQCISQTNLNPDLKRQMKRNHIDKSENAFYILDFKPGEILDERTYYTKNYPTVNLMDICQILLSIYIEASG
jgi:hypothetical protein